MRRPGTTATALACVVVLAACGGGDQVTDDDAATPAPSSSSPAEDVNPVIHDDFPDPDVLEVDGVYYAYGTNGNLRNVRVARSTDLVEWELLEDALPELPSWVIPGKTWAPEVTQLDDGSFALYFTATSYDPYAQCVGVATADAPEGPFTVVGEEMLVCPEEEGGAIDASTFVDSGGTRYLLWKNDGNALGLDTWLHLARLSADGLSLEGEPVRLLTQDQEWEGHLIEAPTLVERDGSYVLLYSANDYGGEQYAVGYATADAVDGPYTKADGPLLTTDATDGRFIGPGGQDVVTAPDGTDRLVFHSWYGDTSYRGVNVLPLEWDDGRPVVVVP
ncbi:glycoside hydrolase family 43 protein [Oceanitalea stevensii]|uniref:Family 43 glycosylhydrolase n=1 Tax=Oceanitalea stevensii TaxID=2763072 RepID=A0ABR8YZ63_9MICO|nr:glycoside hydrolase family 43 protein [Oceanitalea stevensii]MBD8061078.1 family 43 glycosylhydrolase [Oceanitalea stevensii]